MPEQQGLRRYLETLRERIWIIAACVILALGAAITYVIVADPVYEAQADILITPVPTENETLVSLGLLRESNDPSREVDTATQLVTTHAVAERVSNDLGGDQSPEDLLNDVKAEPVAQSNIVAADRGGGLACGGGSARQRVRQRGDRRAHRRAAQADPARSCQGCARSSTRCRRTSSPLRR